MTTIRNATPVAVITAEDTFTAALLVAAGDRVSLSAIRTAFTGTYTLQRNNYGTWTDVTDKEGAVEQWTGVDLETTYVADEGGEIRLGVKTGDFAGTSVSCRLGKG